MTMQFDFYYGNESELFQFVQMPKMLLKDSRFKKLSSDAKIMYALMLDRMGLSQKNGWKDDLNRIYIHYAINSICDDLDCSRPTAMKIVSELDSFGLIERATVSGKSTRYYVKNFIAFVESMKEPVKNIDQSKNLTSQESLPVPVKNLYPNKTEDNKTVKERFIEPAEVRREPVELSEDGRTVDSASIPSDVRQADKYDPEKIAKAAKDKNGKQYRGEKLSAIVCEASRRYSKQAEVDSIGNAWVYYLRVVKSVACQWESMKRKEKKSPAKKSTNRFHNFHQREYSKDDYDQIEKLAIMKSLGGATV